MGNRCHHRSQNWVRLWRWLRNLRWAGLATLSSQTYSRSTKLLHSWLVYRTKKPTHTFKVLPFRKEAGRWSRTIAISSYQAVSSNKTRVLVTKIITLNQTIKANWIARLQLRTGLGWAADLHNRVTAALICTRTLRLISSLRLWRSRTASWLNPRLVIMGLRSPRIIPNTTVMEMWLLCNSKMGYWATNTRHRYIKRPTEISSPLPRLATPTLTSRTSCFSHLFIKMILRN